MLRAGYQTKLTTITPQTSRIPKSFSSSTQRKMPLYKFAKWTYCTDKINNLQVFFKKTDRMHGQNVARLANLCLRAFRHDKFWLRMLSHLEGPGIRLFILSFEISVNILRNQKYMIGLDSYSRQVSNYLDSILIYISLWIDCLFEIRKIAVCFPWLSLPGHYRVTDEALLAETT